MIQLNKPRTRTNGTLRRSLIQAISYTRTFSTYLENKFLLIPIRMLSRYLVHEDPYDCFLVFMIHDHMILITKKRWLLIPINSRTRSSWWFQPICKIFVKLDHFLKQGQNFKNDHLEMVFVFDISKGTL